jgi:hypothetical protein
MTATFTGLALAFTILVQSAPETPATENERQERLRFMKEKAAEFVLARDSAPQKPLPLKDEPVLRFSNPERDKGVSDGAMFLWLDGHRPVAAASITIRRPDDAVHYEHTSFSNVPLNCRRDSKEVWSPQTGGLLEREVTDAPLPAGSMAARLTQMRQIASRFFATCYWGPDTTHLRLLTQPVYRFADEQQGILDGALFAFVVSNDPEMLLLVEAFQDATCDQRRWRFSLARMSSLKHTVLLDDKEIWSILSFYRLPLAERTKGPYIEGRLGTYDASLQTPPMK